MTTRNTGRVLVTTLAALGAGAVLAACGSSGGTTGSGAASAPSSTSVSPPPTQTTTATTTVTPSSSAPPSAPSITPSASSTPPKASDACPDGSMKITMSTLGGAAGHGGFVVHMRNFSDKTCTLHGYPGLDALSSSGATLAHAKRTMAGYIGGVQKGSIPTARLHPGDQASAVAEFATVPSGSSRACKSSAKIAITPPNTESATTIAASVSVCSLQIHPMVPGSTGNVS